MSSNHLSLWSVTFYSFAQVLKRYKLTSSSDFHQSPPSKSVSKSHTVETQHEEMIVSSHLPLPLLVRPRLSTRHEDLELTQTLRFALVRFQHDAQLDYYGKRLATCSSDKTIRVFDVVDGEQKGQGDILRG